MKCVCVCLHSVLRSKLYDRLFSILYCTFMTACNISCGDNVKHPDVRPSRQGHSQGQGQGQMALLYYRSHGSLSGRRLCHFLNVLTLARYFLSLSFLISKRGLLLCLPPRTMGKSLVSVRHIISTQMLANTFSITCDRMKKSEHL